jgi:hypothetical protein
LRLGWVRFHIFQIRCVLRRVRIVAKSAYSIRQSVHPSASCAVCICAAPTWRISITFGIGDWNEYLWR